MRLINSDPIKKLSDDYIATLLGPTGISKVRVTVEPIFDESFVYNSIILITILHTCLGRRGRKRQAY